MDDLRDLARDLSEAPAIAQRASLAIVEKGAHNIKAGWAKNARATSGKHAPSYPNSISYDLSISAALAGRIEAEIGPDKSRPQGPLGNLLEFGSSNNPPHNDGGRALRDEAPKFEDEIGKAALAALGF